METEMIEETGERVATMAATLWFTYGKGARSEAMRLYWLNRRGSERRAFWLAVRESIEDAVGAS